MVRGSIIEGSEGLRFGNFRFVPSLVGISRVEFLMFMLVRHILSLCYSIRALSVEDYSTVERKG